MSNAIRGLTSILTWLRTGLQQRDENLTNALNALYVATNETRLYLHDREEADRSREAELSRLWGAAGIALRNVDRSLADRCFSKASAWVEPEKWDDARIVKADIEIDSMYQELRRITLGGKLPK